MTYYVQVGMNLFRLALCNCGGCRCHSRYRMLLLQQGLKNTSRVRCDDRHRHKPGKQSASRMDLETKALLINRSTDDLTHCISEFFDPFTEQVIGSSTARRRSSRQQQLNQARARAAVGRSLGGSRGARRWYRT